MYNRFKWNVTPIWYCSVCNMPICSEHIYCYIWFYISSRVGNGYCLSCRHVLIVGLLFGCLGMAGCADDVAAWLDKLGLTEYTEKFLAAGYSSLQQCVSLSKADLSAIGIGKVGHVNRLFKDLDRMKANGEIESPSPPRSSSSSPQLLPVVKAVAAPVVPPRRTLPRKPNSDGQLLDSPPPPKLLPRKGSLRKCASAHVMQPMHHSMRNIDEPQVTSKIPSSQSLNDICENQSPELKNDLSSGILRPPPPVAPRKTYILYTGPNIDTCSWGVCFFL